MARRRSRPPSCSSVPDTRAIRGPGTRRCSPPTGCSSCRSVPSSCVPATGVVLLDAGLGMLNSGPHRGGRLLDNLAAIGVRAEEVTDVVLSHLHFDHVG